MNQVIRQIKERRKIDLESKGTKYHLWRLDGYEFGQLRDNSLPIEEPDFRFYRWLFRSSCDRKEELNLAELFVALESIFGESGDAFDAWKGSFSFPVLLIIEKDEKNLFYLMDISDHRGYVYFRLYKIILDGLEGNDAYCPHHKPFAEEFSRDEINYFLSYLYGYILGRFQVLKPTHSVQPFLRKIESNIILYGYKDDDYFELDCETPEEYEAAIKSFEEKYGQESKSTRINSLLQRIMS